MPTRKQPDHRAFGLKLRISENSRNCAVVLGKQKTMSVFQNRKLGREWKGAILKRTGYSRSTFQD